MYDLTICMPGIRTYNWPKFYESIVSSIGNYTFELVMVGPVDNAEMHKYSNYTFIQDFGHPCRCAQRGSESAQGTYFTWSSDDGIYIPGALSELLDQAKTIAPKDMIAVRYTEGQNFAGSPMPDEWYWARYHDDQRLDGVLPEFRIAPVAMLLTSYFRELGGWDCRYEHINMSCHDLAFRLQKDGGSVHLSSCVIMNCDWIPGGGDHQALHDAHIHNDVHLFAQDYGTYNPDRIHIPIDNWKNAPEKWVRRFGES